MKCRIVPIGPYHPLQEEPEFFKLIVEGEKVVGLDIQIGYNHRAHEYVSMRKNFDQITFLIERICGICSTSHPIAYVNAVEDIWDVEIPMRAKYIRSIMGELERIHSHYLWIGLAGHFIGYDTVWMWVWRYREPLLDLLELITGNRNHYAMMKIGGVRRNIEEEDYPAIEKVLNEIEEKTNMFTNAILDDPVIKARLENVGILSKEQAIEYSVVGPTARGSGVAIDVRRDDPYDAYGLIPWDVIVFDEGDVLAKAKVRLLECFESIKIVRECLKRMPKGDIQTKIDEIPRGEGIGRHEAPRGEVFHYVRSDGGKSPVRHKVRAPSYANIPSNEVAVVGYTISDAALTLAAVDPCYCCTERTTIIQDGKIIGNGKDLLEKSWEKTRRLQEKYKK